jgi:hypothetical protein
MNCLICNEKSYYFFNKRFDPPYDEYLGTVEYYKCPNCGFVFSKTHAEMDHSIWLEVNSLFHSQIENPNIENSSNQPPYLEQALMIHVLAQNRMISVGNAIDWAGGHGTLVKLLRKYFQITVPVYEKYMQVQSVNSQSSGEAIVRYVPQSELTTYETVINSAVFEHVTNRKYLDEINSCVADTGSLILHTVVCENIPQNPDWFYLLPVHCAFHSNRSMELLMHQWKYTSSVYCPSAKCWVLFKEGNTRISADAIRAINIEFQSNYVYFKQGFMDYWR